MSCWWWGKSAAACFLAQEIGWGPTIAISFAGFAIFVGILWIIRRPRQ